jgi:hypothetical protein
VSRWKYSYGAFQSFVIKFNHLKNEKEITCSFSFISWPLREQEEKWCGWSEQEKKVRKKKKEKVSKTDEEDEEEKDEGGEDEKEEEDDDDDDDDDIVEP